NKIRNAMNYCNKFAERIFVGDLRSGPLILDKNGIELWEMTGLAKFNRPGTVNYIAFLQTPEGGFIQASGKAPVNSIEKWEKRFRDALFKIERVR
ncbi:MAG: hypothetical protein GY850_28650, partial [bacterium]|nr:hypothetical protein [bacterium]